MTATAPCTVRPQRFPFRCETCPVMGWPPAAGYTGAAVDERNRAAALRDFVDNARCPHDDKPLGASAVAAVPTEGDRP